MDDQPLPLDVARALVERSGLVAVEVAQSRANVAQQGGDMKSHDHALMVLTEVEELVQKFVQQKDISPQNPTFIDDDGSVISDEEMLRRLDGAKAVEVFTLEDIRNGKVKWV